MATTVRPQAKRITAVGQGNIGSQLIAHLASLPGVEGVHLVDGDVYELKNIGCQAILPRDVGRSKARVQAARLRQMNPRLEVTASACWLEDLPWGTLRGDLLIAGLDSRAARQWVNEIACRLGMTWIDTAVDASGLLVRVNIYAPGPATACLECAWNEDDYAAIEQKYACRNVVQSAAPTNAPTSLGALAAALAGIECRKLLSGQEEDAAVGSQLFLDARHHQYWVTRYRRNPNCRFDHQAWEIHPLPVSPRRMTWRQLLDQVAPQSPCEASAVRVAGQGFTRSLLCSACGVVPARHAALERRMPRALKRCPQCRQTAQPAGIDTDDWLPTSLLSARDLQRSLAGAGLRIGDVLSVHTEATESHYELVPLR